ncbi:ImmA/IrrE family metallo-endopeptidase [Leptospira noguchii]|nr:ImmA/IrrE family metallo-endopeptidase [Leptospira noguchii]
MSTFDLDFDKDFYVNNRIDNLDSLKSIIAKFRESDLKKLTKAGVLNKDDAQFELLSLLMEEINSPLFRTSNDKDNLLNNLWLSKASQKAKLNRATSFYNEFNSSLITNDFLHEIAKLSFDLNNVSKMQSILMKYGIILIYEKYIQGTKIDGACFKLNDGTPVITISSRFNRLDSYWFTLLHEIAHIILHYEFLNSPIIDDLYTNDKSENKIERQANNLAKSAILNRSYGRSLITEIRNLRNNTKEASDLISIYSKESHIHPALIAGVLSFELNNYTLFSKLLNSFNVREVIFEK